MFSYSRQDVGLQMHIQERQQAPSSNLNPEDLIGSSIWKESGYVRLINKIHWVSVYKLISLIVLYYLVKTHPSSLILQLLNISLDMCFLLLLLLFLDMCILNGC